MSDITKVKIGQTTYDIKDLSADKPYEMTTFESTEESDEYVELKTNTITTVVCAEGNSYSISIADVSDDSSIAKDCLLKLDCSGCATAPTIDWGSLTPKTDSTVGGWAKIATPNCKAYLYSFTEIKKGEFIASRKELV